MNLYKVAHGISLLLGDDSLEDYLYKLVQRDVQMELETGGDLLHIIDDERLRKQVHGELWPPDLSRTDQLANLITNQFLFHIDR